MSLVDLIDALRQTMSLHLGKVVFSVAAIIVGYALYKVVAREIRRLKEQKRLEEHIAYSLTRIVQWAAVAAILLGILAQFGVTIAMISGLFTLLRGTIIGFAAVNTLGNAIAGLIVMSSRPFRVGDRYSSMANSPISKLSS
jgi:small-conductance mechanosensitive channel